MWFCCNIVAPIRCSNTHCGNLSDIYTIWVLRWWESKQSGGDSRSTQKVKCFSEDFEAGCWYGSWTWLPRITGLQATHVTKVVPQRRACELRRCDQLCRCWGLGENTGGKVHSIDQHRQSLALCIYVLLCDILFYFGTYIQTYIQVPSLVIWTPRRVVDFFSRLTFAGKCERLHDVKLGDVTLKRCL